MVRIPLSLLSLALACAPLAAQYETDTVSQALRHGQYLESRKKFDLALEAYRWADKQAHHTSPVCYLRIAAVECKMGRFSDALDDAKRAEKVAGSNKITEVQAHVLRAAILVQMSGKPGDKRLKEAEGELRQALAADSEQVVLHYDLGMVLLKQGNDAEGIAELKLYAASPRASRGSLDEVQRIIANPIRARAPFAPDFAIVTLQKEQLTNASLRGKVVLLDFWGAWCEPCRESVPMLRNLQKEFAGPEFQLVGISSDDEEEVVRKFVRAQQMDWQEHLDISGDVSALFHVESVPTFLVLDKDGVVRFRQSGWGPSSQGELEEVIRQALKRAPNPALAAAYGASTPPAAASAEGAEGPAGGEAAVREPPLSPVELGRVEGGVFTDPALGIRYQLPAGWIAVSPEDLHRTNLRTEAKLRHFAQRHPDLPSDVNLEIPQFVLYASKKGEGDGERIAVPCLRFSVTPAKASELSLQDFQQFAESIGATPGTRLRRPAATFTVKGHTFVRADLERGSGESHAFEALVRTMAGNQYMLEIELFANTAMEMQNLVDTLETMTFSPAEH